ncbi:mucin-17-like [Sycon ciliatum]|uniref:mucin-17-like n=1 Tax=Sycon ciliatum TaxID=27933 RepID=UPI0031F6E967
MVGRGSHCDVTYTVVRGDYSPTWGETVTCGSSPCCVSYAFHNFQDALKRQSYGPSSVTVLVKSSSHCSIKGSQVGVVSTPLFNLFMEYSNGAIITAATKPSPVPIETQAAVSPTTARLLSATSSMKNTAPNVVSSSHIASATISPSQSVHASTVTPLSSVASTSFASTKTSPSEGITTDEGPLLTSVSLVTSSSTPSATILTSELVQVVDSGMSNTPSLPSSQDTTILIDTEVTTSRDPPPASSSHAQRPQTTDVNDAVAVESPARSTPTQSRITVGAATTHRFRPTAQSYTWMIGSGVGALLLLGIILSVLLYCKVKHTSSALRVPSDSSGGEPGPIEARTLACENPQYGVAEDIPVRFNVSSSQSGYSDVDVQYVDGNQVLSEDTTYDTMIKSYTLHGGKSDAKAKPSTQLAPGGEQQQLENGVGEQPQYDRLDITLRRDSYAEVVPRNLRTPSTNITATAEKAESDKEPVRSPPKLGDEPYYARGEYETPNL